MNSTSATIFFAESEKSITFKDSEFLIAATINYLMPKISYF